MARQYGVTVRAFNISREQIAFARERAQREGLADRVEFIEDDYRNVAGHFDVFVSVGMLEHVGLRELPDARRGHRRVAEPTRAAGLLHFIGRNRPSPLQSAGSARRIFPGAYPPTLREVFERRPRAAASFSVLDVENLRLHYARTLEHWRRRFERRRGRVRDDVRRALRPRVAAVSGRLAGGVHHRLDAALPGRVRAAAQQRRSPWTRADMYRR